MDAEQRDLLLSMAYLYLACGRERRALPLLLLLLVATEHPADLDCLRALAYAYTATDHGDLAMTTVERLEELEAAPHNRGLLLLRSRALYKQARLPEARACFSRCASHGADAA